MSLGLQRPASDGGEVLDSFFNDPLLKALLAASWPYNVLPPSRLSFLTFAQYLSVSSQGNFFCEGGFQSIVDALVSALEGGGGELLLSTLATGIPVDGSRVAGVELAGGSVLATDVVVSAAAARPTLLQLVGEEHLPPGFVRRLRRMEPSLSAFIAFGVLKDWDSELPVGHDTFAFKYVDHDDNYRDMRRGRPAALMVSTPTIVDPSLAPPGEHVLNFTAPIAYDIGASWDDESERVLEETIAVFESRVPELRGRVEIVETGTPLTLELYTGNEGGAMLGWAFTPDQSASHRLTSRPPVEGLLLAGHWTQPGAGALRALVSGFYAGQIVLERHGIVPPRLPLAIDSAWRRKFARSATG